MPTVKYIYYAKDQHYSFITKILLVLTTVHRLFLIYTAFETDPNTKFSLVKDNASSVCLCGESKGSISS